MISFGRVAGRARWTLRLFLWFAVALTWLPADSRGAEDGPRRPAVEAVNGGVSLSYAYGDTKRDGAPGLFGSLSSSNHDWAIDGWITVPLGTAFGARASLAGGQSFERGGFFVFVPPLDEEGDWIVVGGQVFWRNPDRGSVTFGYQYARTHREGTDQSLWQRLPWLRPMDENRHTIGAGGELFVGPVDIVLDVSYSPRTSDTVTLFDPKGTDTTFHRVGTLVGPRWHVADSVLLAAGFEWQREDGGTLQYFFGGSPAPPIGPVEVGQYYSNTYAGTFAAQWLLPTGRRRPVILAAWGDVGRLNVRGPDQFGGRVTTYLTYHVGVSVTLLLPGPESLREWYRAYR